MNKQTQQKAAREVAAECGDLYEEICDLQKKLGWSTQKQLCEKAYVAMHNESDFEAETFETEIKGTRNFQERVKKMFQRKTWEKNKSTEKTLIELTKIRDAIYLTEDYRDSSLYVSDLPPEIRKAMAKESIELRQWLKENDYEE